MYAPLLERMDIVEDVRLNRDQSSARLFWAKEGVSASVQWRAGRRDTHMQNGVLISHSACSCSPRRRRSIDEGR
jgi:hypothetical protein